MLVGQVGVGVAEDELVKEGPVAHWVVVFGELAHVVAFADFLQFFDSFFIGFIALVTILLLRVLILIAIDQCKGYEASFVNWQFLLAHPLHEVVFHELDADVNLLEFRAVDLVDELL